MRQRLGRTGMCFLFLMTFSAVMNDPGPDARHHSTGLIPVATAHSTNGPRQSINLTTDVESAIEAARQPKSVPPSGWRRTNRGWEKVDLWAKQFPDLYGPERTLDDWISHHQQERPIWIELSFAQLRRMPPLGIAGLQVIAIWLITRQARSPHRTTSERKNAIRSASEIAAS